MGFIWGLVKFIGVIVGIIFVTIGLTLFASQFADGPWAMISGGPFKTGEEIRTEPDWSFVKDLQEVEFQLVSTGTSRTTWIMEHEGRVFIPSAYMNSTVGKIWKQWPAKAEADGRMLLRIDGKIYARHLKRVMSDPDLKYVLDEITRKYAAQFGDSAVPVSEVESGNLWIFELLPPRAA